MMKNLPVIGATLKLTRRALLKFGFASAGVALLPVLSLFKSREAVAGTVFNTAEEQHITMMVNDIIPEDADPGAAQAGTPEYTVFYLSSLDSSSVANIKAAIYAMDLIATNIYGIGFTACTTLQREAVYGIVKGDPQLSVFWYSLRSIAVVHFYAQPLGYEQAGLPGPSVDDQRFFDADQRSIRLCGQQAGV